MNPTIFFGKQILKVLEEFRSSNGVIDYTKVEGDEFLKFLEDGYYLHSRNGTGEINNCRIYFESRDGYFPAKISSRGEFGECSTLADFEAKLGTSVKEIRAVKIPGAEPTLSGKFFKHHELTVKVYSSDGHTVSYIHLSPV